MAHEFNNENELINYLSEYFHQNKKINFSEKIFNFVDCVSTYQGEGPNCGKKMLLTRFKYCNLLCPFCDTQKLTCDIEPVTYSLKDLQLILKNVPNLMITGGEPTLHTTEISQLVSTIIMIRELKYDYVDVETNGLNIIPLIMSLNNYVNDNVNLRKKINISWSPKFVTCAHYSENIAKVKRLKDIKTTTNEICIEPIFKIVIGDDMEEYEQFAYDIVLRQGYDPNKVYLMPKGVTYDEINKSMDRVLAVAGDLSCNVSSRLHVLHNFK